MEEVEFTQHARGKFAVLERHGFVVTPEQVRDAVIHPDRLIPQSGGRYLAQKGISSRHVRRVIYREAEGVRVVIPFSPGRRARDAADV